MTISIAEFFTGAGALIGIVWAIAATFYRPKDIDLTPIYTKLDKISEFLTQTREAYVSKSDLIQQCNICKQDTTNKFETLKSDIKDIHDRIDDVILKKKG